MNVVVEAKKRAVSLLSESIYDNPLVTRDFRTRMRGWKAFSLMGIYLLLLAGILLIAFYSVANESRYQYHSQFVLNRYIGRDLFNVLVWVQAILLTLTLPALTSSSLTSETEKKTIEMLVLSSLTPGKIVFGMQLSGFLYSLMLLICSIPLAGICLMLGGISPEEIIIAYILLACWGFLITCGGVFWSSMHKRSPIASGNCFGCAIGYFILTAIYGGASGFASYYSGGMTAEPLSLLNPVWAPFGAMKVANVCGVRISVALIAIIMHIAMGILLLLVASTHVRYTKTEKALPIRLLILGLSAFTMWLMAGGSIPFSKDSIVYVGAVVMIVSMLMASVFATGQYKTQRNSSYIRYILSIRKTFSSNLGGAIFFMLIWVLVTYGVYGAASFWANKAAPFGNSASVIQVVHSMMPSSHSQHSQSDAAFWMAYWKIGAYLLAVSVCFSAIGLFMSASVKQRRNAVALVIALALLSFAVYGIALISYVDSQNGNSPIWNLAVFWPITPLLISTGNWDNLPQLTWSHSAWIMCSVAYVYIANMLIIFASFAFKKTGGVQEETE